MKYFSISSVVEAYNKVSASTKEKFWGILGILHSVDETVSPNKSYSVETGKLSQFFEDLFRLHEKREYSGTDEYSFVFSSHWVDVVSEDYLVGRPEITPILVWAYRNQSFSNEISVSELFNRFLEDYHVSKEVAEQLFKISFTEQLKFEDNRYSDSDLLLKLGGSEASGSTTLKLNGAFAVANAGDLSRGPYFQPLYAALQTLKCLTIYPFNIHDYYNLEDYGNQEEEESGVSEDEMDFRSRQVIYYGAPGTGKSNTIKREVDDKNKINFRVTFHPDSDYSTFVGCYKPTTVKTGERAAQPILDYDSLVDKFKEYLTVPNVNITKACTLFGFDYHDSIIRIQENGHKVMDLVNDAYKSNTSYDSVVRGGMACYEQNPNLGGGSKITYEFVPQAFTKAYTAAWNTDENVYLVIEEINRGNCAQIFGDLFQLLDRKKGISEYPVDADSDLAEHIRKELRNSTREDIPDSVREGKKLVFPSNLYIYATMNTSDQSLFPIDSAFKRRWDWMYVPIADAQKGWKIDVEGKMYDWWDFLSKINDLVGTATSSEDKKLGYFFCKANGNVISAETFVSKVVFYLWNDVFKDFPQEAGKGFTDSDGSVLSFNKFYYVDRGGITRVRKDKVRMMLDNLGVSSGDSTVDTEKMEADAATSSKNTLKEIVFPDGTVIDASKGTFDAYIEAIKKMGVDKVCSVADDLKYRRRGRPLISKEQYPEMISEYGYSYVTLGEYNFLKGTKTYTYVRILEDLAEKLGITITIHN